MPDKKIHTTLAFLIGISLIVRAFLAGMLELGNDEVYYWIYALYPDFSHFDHPPMVGYIIQLFSLDLLFDHEFFLRLGSLVFGAINTWIIYLIGKQIKNPITGLYAAFLYTSSVYGFIITGVFILPDTPQLFFWLLSFLFILKSLLADEFNFSTQKNLIGVGIFTGLAMISKYTSVFIWVGIIGYILLFDRRWLKVKTFYFALLLSLIIFSPIIWWNIQHDFISFSFQSERVAIFALKVRPDYFLMEILGEILYNNPVNYILIVIAVIAVINKREILMIKYVRFILLVSLPLISTFIIFSLFRRTLPHWTAPAFTMLILLASARLSNLSETKTKKQTIPTSIKGALYLLSIVIIIGLLQIKVGVINFSNATSSDPTQLGKKDISLQIYGWRQIGSEFADIVKKDKLGKNIGSNPVLMSYRWFPTANLDYYAAFPLGINAFAVGPIADIHKYYWINEKRGGFKLGMDAYYITTSYDYHHPKHGFAKYFKSIEAADTIQIKKGNKHVMNAFVFRMKNMKRIPVMK